jgi:hypothetical protein
VSQNLSHTRKDAERRGMADVGEWTEVTSNAWAATLAASVGPFPEIESVDHPDRGSDANTARHATQTGTSRGEERKEQTHDAAEDERIIAEEGRLSAERERRGREDARESAEGRRSSDEWRREEAERLRDLAEKARQIAEDAREIAEAARREAELARQETMALDRRFSDQQEILGEMQRTLRALEQSAAGRTSSSRQS